MNKVIIKYSLNLVQQFLCIAVLVFSVFSFSGFNPQIHSKLNESAKTELTESRTRKPAYKLKKTSKKQINLLQTNPLSSERFFTIWAVLNHNTAIKTKFRAYRNRTLLYCIRSIKLLFKNSSSSSKDESPFSFS